MTDKPIHAERLRRTRPDGAPGLATYAAALLSIGTVVWSLRGIIKQSAPMAADIRLPFLLAAGGCVLIAAVVAQVGNSSAAEMLTAARRAIGKLFGFTQTFCNRLRHKTRDRD